MSAGTQHTDLGLDCSSQINILFFIKKNLYLFARHINAYRQVGDKY